MKKRHATSSGPNPIEMQIGNLESCVHKHRIYYLICDNSNVSFDNKCLSVFMIFVFILMASAGSQMELSHS